MNWMVDLAFVYFQLKHYQEHLNDNVYQLENASTNL